MSLASPAVDRRPWAILLMGPTASGKTDLALTLATKLPCELISVDASLVYRGLDIGTAKPTPEILACYPHHLINIREIWQTYNVGAFRRDALRLMSASVKQGKIPLLVGGTMLYFNALVRGLAPLPPANSALRTKLSEQAMRKGWSRLHQFLEKVDPVAAQRIHPNDSQRLQRALEVFLLTGKSLTQWQCTPAQEEFPYRVLPLALAPASRSCLHVRIHSRFYQMLELGFIEEVENLRANSALSMSMPALKAVGYCQIWNYLDRLYDYETLCEKTLAATRQLAKRQITWLRSWPDLEWFDSQNPELYPKVLKKLRSHVT